MPSLDFFLSNLSWPMTLSLAIGSIVLLGLHLRSRNSKGPPQLNDTIPYVTNTIQYLTDAGTFMDRAKQVVLSMSINILRNNQKLP